MKPLEKIRRQLAQGQFDFTRHALRRAVERNIPESEIRQMAENARIIEDYPQDKYTPSCLLLGFTKSGRPLHMQVSYADSELARIITLYEPDPNEWIEFEKRR
ncbi:MAG: hypothetical protein FD146_1881 [Anaerolineaceae bacterium]|nr:MAG: hypothetical protein FD146_1881 [Anaerolineaceae bacterium]